MGLFRKQKDPYEKIPSSTIVVSLDEVVEKLREYEGRLNELTEARSTMDQGEYTLQIQYVEHQVEHLRSLAEEMKAVLSKRGDQALRASGISLD